MEGAAAAVLEGSAGGESERAAVVGSRQDPTAYAADMPLGLPRMLKCDLVHNAGWRRRVRISARLRCGSASRAFITTS